MIEDANNMDVMNETLELDEEKTLEMYHKENCELILLYKEELERSGLSDKTITRHISNIEHYLNRYIVDYCGERFNKGIEYIGEYLGNFFIRKCMWSTPQQIGSTATSIKKFYKCMLNNGKISEDDYEMLCSEISFGLDEWKEDCAIYNDPTQPMPFDIW